MRQRRWRSKRQVRRLRRDVPQHHFGDVLRRLLLAAGEVMSTLKMLEKVWRFDTLKKQSALIDMCRSSGSMSGGSRPPRRRAGRCPAVVAIADQFTSLVLANARYCAVVDVLDHHQADEVGILDCGGRR